MINDEMISLTVAKRIASRPFLAFEQADIDDDEIREVTDVVQSGDVGAGTKKTQFETKFAKAVGAKHAIALDSSTEAMHIALEAIGVTHGDEVITTPYAFESAAGAIRYVDATPVFVDVDAETMNIDSDRIEAAVTSHTKAILPVHTAGLPAEMDRIRSIADTFKLPVVAHAAHALMSKYNGARIGALSDITCFSCCAESTVGAGDGGMLCTENDDYAAVCRMLASHGTSRESWRRHAEEVAGYGMIVHSYSDHRMSDLAAAMGLARLRHADAMLRKRTSIAHAYNKGFSHFPQFQLPHDDARHRHAWQLYMLRLNLDKLAIDRALYVEELKRRHIGVGIHFIPLHMQPLYRQLYHCTPDDFPIAYREYMREISLPIYSTMTPIDVEDVIDAVVDVLMQFGR